MDMKSLNKETAIKLAYHSLQYLRKQDDDINIKHQINILECIATLKLLAMVDDVDLEVYTV
jgi:hypothetical protein